MTYNISHKLLAAIINAYKDDIIATIQSYESWISFILIDTYGYYLNNNSSFKKYIKDYSEYLDYEVIINKENFNTALSIYPLHILSYKEDLTEENYKKLYTLLKLEGKL